MRKIWEIVVCSLFLLLVSSFWGCGPKNNDIDSLQRKTPSKWTYKGFNGLSVDIEVYLFQQSKGLEVTWKSFVDLYHEQLKHQEDTMAKATDGEILSLSEELANYFKIELMNLESNWENWQFQFISQVFLEDEKPTKMIAACRHVEQPYDVIFLLYSDDVVSTEQAYEVLRRITLAMQEFSQADWKKLPHESEKFFDDNGIMITERFEDFLNDSVFIGQD